MDGILHLEYCPRCGRDLDNPGNGYCRFCKWEQGRQTHVGTNRQIKEPGKRYNPNRHYHGVYSSVLELYTVATFPQRLPAHVIGVFPGVRRIA